MPNKLMAGVWRLMIGVPPFLWEKQIERAGHKVNRSTRFMTPEHRLVHHFAVRELPRAGGPLSPEMAARELGIPVERIKELLQELEERLTFLVRNSRGQVVWAYPVTVEKTTHAITFGSGEALYAA
ncbi:MAG: hypothetical protein HY892_05745 [Deltaproteobacteria bacterium]|nr:hypothetical protein [Deltaproteobacteria bacterium]